MLVLNYQSLPLERNTMNTEIGLLNKGHVNILHWKHFKGNILHLTWAMSKKALTHLSSLTDFSETVYIFNVLLKQALMIYSCFCRFCSLFLFCSLPISLIIIIIF